MTDTIIVTVPKAPVVITTPGEQGPRGAPGADSTVPGPMGPPGQDGAQGTPGTPGADSTVPGPMGPPGDSVDIAADTHAATDKATPVDADEIPLVDSAASWVLKKLSWANIKATLAGVFLPLTGGTIAGGTRTVAGSTLTITETLNNAAVTFPGALVIDQTHTASGANSLLADFKVGGVSVAGVNKFGKIHVSDGIVSAPSLFGLGGSGPATTGISWNNWNQLTFSSGGEDCFTNYGTGIRLTFDKLFGWSSGASMTTGADLSLYRDAANNLAQRNGTNAQTSRIYGTYTDASNYRRVAIAVTTAGVASIKPEGAGTGASGNVLHISGLPAANPGPGIIWNDAGTVKVGT